MSELKYRHFQTQKFNKVQEEIDKEFDIIKRCLSQITSDDISYKESDKDKIVVKKMVSVTEHLNPTLNIPFECRYDLEDVWDDYFEDTEYDYELMLEWVNPFGLHLLITLILYPKTPPPNLVRANRQLSGKGRLKREWISGQRLKIRKIEDERKF